MQKAKAICCFDKLTIVWLLSLLIAARKVWAANSATQESSSRSAHQIRTNAEDPQKPPREEEASTPDRIANISAMAFNEHAIGARLRSRETYKKALRRAIGTLMTGSEWDVVRMSWGQLLTLLQNGRAWAGEEKARDPVAWRDLFSWTTLSGDASSGGMDLATFVRIVRRLHTLVCRVARERLGATTAPAHNVGEGSGDGGGNYFTKKLKSAAIKMIANFGEQE